MDAPHCFNTDLLSSSTICYSCPFFLACCVERDHLPDIVFPLKKGIFLRRLLIEEVPPRYIDSAYMKLYGANMNAAKSARKYARKKLDKAHA